MLDSWWVFLKAQTSEIKSYLQACQSRSNFALKQTALGDIQKWGHLSCVTCWMKCPRVWISWWFNVKLFNAVTNPGYDQRNSILCITQDGARRFIKGTFFQSHSKAKIHSNIYSINGDADLCPSRHPQSISKLYMERWLIAGNTLSQYFMCLNALCYVLRAAGRVQDEIFKNHFARGYVSGLFWIHMYTKL